MSNPAPALARTEVAEVDTVEERAIFAQDPTTTIAPALPIATKRSEVGIMLEVAGLCSHFGRGEDCFQSGERSIAPSLTSNYPQHWHNQSKLLPSSTRRCRRWQEILCITLPSIMVHAASKLFRQRFPVDRTDLLDPTTTIKNKKYSGIARRVL